MSVIRCSKAPEQQSSVVDRPHASRVEVEGAPEVGAGVPHVAGQAIRLGDDEFGSSGLVEAGHRLQGAAQGIVIESASGKLEGGYDRRPPAHLAVERPRGQC
jgi:hypothetical protein